MMSRAGWKRVFPRRLFSISARSISPKSEAHAPQGNSISEIRIMENEIFSEQPFAPIISKVNFPFFFYLKKKTQKIFRISVF